jgi:hypothetical protein
MPLLARCCRSRSYERDGHPIQTSGWIGTDDGQGTLPWPPLMYYSQALDCVHAVGVGCGVVGGLAVVCSLRQVQGVPSNGSR